MPVTARPEAVAYLRAVASSAPGRIYKAAAAAAMDLRPGLHVLEVGCGPGTDLLTFAQAVGPRGRVTAVDADPAMAELARAAVRADPGAAGLVEVVRGDVHGLDLPDESCDRVHADRVVQHLDDPLVALREMARVLRPGGLVVLAEPDWATLVVGRGDPASTRAFVDHTCRRVVRNAHIGSQLPHLGVDAGLELVSVDASTAVFEDAEQADLVFGFTRNAEVAVAGGHLDRPAVEALLGDLQRPPFLAAVTVFLVVLRRPPRR